MACLYKRGKRFWVSYLLDGQLVQRSLRTDNERVAKAKVKAIESELVLGDHHVVSKLPLQPILEAFCRHLAATRTHKSYKNDFSRLRVCLTASRSTSRPRCPHLAVCLTIASIPRGVIAAAVTGA